MLTFSNVDMLKDYIILEINVPDGYQLLETPIKVKGEDMINADAYILELTVDNPTIPRPS